MRNSIGMDFVRIEPGAFSMGQERDGGFDERPVHRVRITRPFHIGATQVTNAQYEQFDLSHRRLRGKLGFSKDDDEAVVFVSWHEAVAFCQWLSEKEGRPYRLPTEAEWEYACRAGTTTAYHTGAELPEVYHKNQRIEWDPNPVPLHVATTPPNPWGLCDMHGNVEEWCFDWYGPYVAGEQTDPVGYADGDSKVTRGGSHGTGLIYLRSANRAGALPDDKHWLIGFRVVQAEPPPTEPIPAPPAPLCMQNVSQQVRDWSYRPDTSEPYFEGPIPFVNIPPGSNGPIFSQHNHCPSIAPCPNGDLLALWYTTNSEPGRELAIAASRLRQGARVWDQTSLFYKIPDRNMHTSSIWWDGKGTLYHFNGVSASYGWNINALLFRTSADSGVTWSTPRWINQQHGWRNLPMPCVFSTRDGTIVVPCDVAARDGATIHVSNDGGMTWADPGIGTDPLQPEVRAGASGGTIAGEHAGVVELEDHRLMALGRGDNIDDRMPMSISYDMGKTWTYSASPFPPIRMGQRLVLKRLQEGPILLLAFTDETYRVEKDEDPAAAFKDESDVEVWAESQVRGSLPICDWIIFNRKRGMQFADAAGKEYWGYGLYAALSFDDGETWPVRKLVTPGDGEYNGGAWTGRFKTDATHAEPRGYLAATQTPDGIIHLVSSALHYRFNLAWLQTPAANIDDSSEQSGGMRA
jgi:hypothetical protein